MTRLLVVGSSPFYCLIARQADPARPYLYSAFVSVAVTAMFSWSLWAAWFMASIGLAASYCATAGEIAGRARTQSEAG